jgi:hypothetical protein
MIVSNQFLRAALSQAAVCDSFDARALVSAIQNPIDKREVLQRLARDSIEIERDGHYRWALRQSVRERVLAKLNEAEFREALAAQPDDPLAIQFARILGNKKGPADSTSLYYRALELLRLAQSPGATIPHDDLESHARHARAMLDRQSSADALRSMLRTPLRGRGKPMAFLREFVRNGVRAIEAQHASPAGTTLYRADQAQRRWPDLPALLLSGSGGVGKSALMAELIRLERGPHWKHRLIVHFDFDEPSLKAGDQGAMMLEFSRQIALARPTLDTVMADSRVRLRQGLRGMANRPDGAFENLKFLAHVEFSHWRIPFEKNSINEVLLVLDTLEEVTTVDFARLDALFGWLDALRQDVGLHRLLVIGSGRALVPDGGRARLWPYFLAELALGDLSARAARSMLRDRLQQERRETHVDQVWRCVEVFGSNPLALIILAHYCVDNDAEALAALLADSQAAEGQYRLGAAAQRLLYARLLERVRDVDIRPLANPGLVLRRVTPQLISEVLAIPCGLDPINSTQAEGLLEKLRRLAWLVIPDKEGVRHRPDIRRQILPMILDRERERSAAINRAAAQWYADRSSGRDAALLESWYHRGLLGEVASQHEDDLRALHDHLREDVDDLPLAVRAQVKYVGGRSLTVREQSALPVELQMLLANRQSKRLSMEGLDQAAFGKASIGFATAQPLQPSGIAVSTNLKVNLAISPRFDAQGDTELATTLFATGEFEATAAHLPFLLARFWRCLQQGEYTEARLIGDAAWLAAASARAFPPERVDWPNLIHESLSQFGETSSESEKEKMFMQAMVLDVLRNSSAPRFSDLLRMPGDRNQALSLRYFEDWKPALVSARSGRQNVSASLAALPFLDPTFLELQRLLSREANDTIEFSSIRGEWINTVPTSRWPEIVKLNAIAQKTTSRLAVLLKKETSWDLPRIREMLQCAHDVEVSFDLSTVRGRFSPVGLVPELYAPVRNAFHAELQPPQIASLVMQVTASLPTWPIELAPHQFEAASKDRSNELLPILLIVSDYHGCFGQLIHAAAAQGSSTQQLVRAAQLFDAYEAAWAL